MATERQPKLTKRVKAVRAKFDRSKSYPVDEALTLVKANGHGQVQRVDRRRGQPRRRRQEVRPDGARLGRDARRHGQDQFAWRCSPRETRPKLAQDAGADIVGFDDLAARVKEGFMKFDVVIASPDAMRVVGQLGQILGPRGLMPNPKVGTVNARRGHGGEERQGRPGSVPDGQGRDRAMHDRPRLVRAGAAQDQSGGPDRRAQQGEAGRLQRRVPAQGERFQHHGCGGAGGHGSLAQPAAQ